MKPIIEGSYTNGLGQELQPGDAVVVIAQGYSHCLSERLGVYLGYRGDGRYKTPVVRVTVKDGRKNGSWRIQPARVLPAREVVRSYSAGRVYKTC